MHTVKMKMGALYSTGLLTISLLLLSIRKVGAEIEICTDGGQNVFRITQESCPFGILMMEPYTADCIVFTGEDPSLIIEDMCAKTEYNLDRRTFQYFPEISQDELQPEDSCKSLLPSMCNMPTLTVRPETFLRRVTDVDFQFSDESNGTNKDSVRAQTQRMFQYMMGLGKVDIDESLRVVVLLKMTFQIFKKFTPARFIRPEFWEDVETAFLFLLNEADSTRLQDVTSEEFESVMEHLTFCSDHKNPFVWEGLKCATYSVIQRVRKHEQLFNDFDEVNKDSFMKYDVPIEATWGAIDFVHGLCYGTFRDHINNHHMYQRAMERLFTKEILYRWGNRFVFQGQQDIWSHFFSANVKNALMNMDVCIQASYMSTPFLHRLERPIDGKARKKRSPETHALRSFESVEGYCFRTQDEVNDVLTMTLCD